MNKLTTAALVVVLGLMVGSCACDDDTTGAKTTTVVYCKGSTPVFGTVQGEVAGTQFRAVSASDSPSDYDCSNPNVPVKRSRGNDSSVACPRRAAAMHSTTAQGRSSGAVPAPAQRLLDLPFGARPASNDPVATAPCDPNGPDQLVVSPGNSRLIRYGACTPVRKASIPLPDTPVQVAVTPDNSLAIVTSFTNAVTFIDLRSNTIVSTLNVGSSTPTGVDISPDGKTAYVTSFSETFPELIAIDIPNRTVLSRTTIGSFAESVFITPDGTQAWLTFPLGNLVQVYDLASMTLVTQIPVLSSYSIAFNSTGTRAYITSQGSSPGKVVEVDMSNYQILRSFDAGLAPFDIEISYADSLLFVTNILDNSVTGIWISTGASSTVKLDGQPRTLVSVQ